MLIVCYVALFMPYLESHGFFEWSFCMTTYTKTAEDYYEADGLT